MKKTIIILFLFCNSCIFVRIDDSIDLGGKYRYIQDYPQTIIHYNTQNYKGIGEEVILPIVLKYSFNDDYIFAKTKDLENNDTIFWIVNKSLNNTVKYEDSVAFYNFLHEKKLVSLWEK